jgi:cytochrome c
MLVVAASSCTPPKTTLVSAEELSDIGINGDDQGARGVWLYGRHCAGCHGDDGAGDEDSPRIHGKGALPETPAEGAERKASFRTARDVFGYVKASMPPMAPGSLKDDEYWAIVAYTLREAAMKPADPLSATNADAPLR